MYSSALKKVLTTITILFLAIIGISTPVSAQDQPILEPQIPQDSSTYVSQINLPDVSIVSRPNVFSIAPQFDLEPLKNVTYAWDFGDGNRDQGQEVVHTYTTPGTYNIKVDISFGNELNQPILISETRDIYVAQKFSILLTDRADKETTINNFLELARKDNISFQLIEAFNSQSAFLSEEVLFTKLNEAKENINKTDTVFVWTNSGSGLNALSRLIQADETGTITLSNTSIVLINSSVNNSQRLERQFQQLKPREIIVIQEPGFIPFLNVNNITDYKTSLANDNYEYTVINQRTSQINPLLTLSYFLNFLSEQGIPDNVLILILLVPVIATVVAFLKQVIGIASLGLYTPTIITLAFLILGLAYGIVILLVITLVSSIVYRLLKKFRLLYIPKMAILLTIISLAIFALFTLALYLNILDTNTVLTAVFPTVVIGTLLEKVVTARGSGVFKTLFTIFETILVSVIAYIIVGGPITIGDFSFQIEFIRNFILNYPESILLIIIINIGLGRWTGLRVSEYVKFREVINNIEE